MPVPRIDAHHHIWSVARRASPWPGADPFFHRPFLLSELQPELDHCGVDGTVVVQAGIDRKESAALLSMALHHDVVWGVVASMDITMDAAETINHLRALPGGDLLVGIRHPMQGERDRRWLMRRDVQRGLAAIADAGLAFDVLVTHCQLPAVVEAIDALPDVRLVLDHAGKPPIAQGLLDPWREHLRAIAEHPLAACKLSGLVTLAAARWSVDDLAPFAGHVIDCFGADRVMAGSDWPICLLRGTYSEVHQVTTRLLEPLDLRQRAAVLGGTASRWYRLPERNVSQDLPDPPPGPRNVR